MYACMHACMYVCGHPPPEPTSSLIYWHLQYKKKQLFCCPACLLYIYTDRIRYIDI